MATIRICIEFLITVWVNYSVMDRVNHECAFFCRARNREQNQCMSSSVNPLVSLSLYILFRCQVLISPFMAIGVLYGITRWLARSLYEDIDMWFTTEWNNDQFYWMLPVVVAIKFKRPSVSVTKEHFCYSTWLFKTTYSRLISRAVCDGGWSIELNRTWLPLYSYLETNFMCSVSIRRRHSRCFDWNMFVFAWLK